MIGDDKDFSGKVCVKWKNTEFERQILRSESVIPRGDAIHAQATVGNRRSAAEGASSGNQEVDKHPSLGYADSLLSHVEITGDFDFKDHAQRRKPLFCL